MNQHTHRFTRRKPSSKVETCPCGAFRHIDVQPEEVITEQPADHVVREALAQTFGIEWVNLSEADRVLIVRDCTEGDKDLKSIAAAGDYAQYRSNIGAGNLAKYARVMRVRFGGK